MHIYQHACIHIHFFHSFTNLLRVFSSFVPIGGGRRVGRWLLVWAIARESIDPFEISRRADFNWITRKGKGGEGGGGERDGKREKRAPEKGPNKRPFVPAARPPPPPASPWHAVSGPPGVSERAL